jgi:hypothetical protein
MILISRFHETGERIKMKLFKKALVATALVSAFGAQAVKVSSEKVKISKEGTEFGLKALVATTTGDDDFVLDFVIGALTPSGSYITLTFGDNVGLSNVVSNDSAIDNAIGTGEGFANVETGNATFSYGTGSFTFDEFTIDQNDDDQDTIQFKVNLGNTIPAGSAFRLTLRDFGTANGVELAGAGEVCYESRTELAEDSAVIESGCSTISEVASQFSFLVTQEFDGKIERVAQDSFARKSDNNVNTQDTLKFKLSNNEELAAALTVANATVVLEGDFTAVTANTVSDANIGTTALATAPVPTADDITFELAASEITNEGVAVEVVTNFDANDNGNAITIPQTGDIDATVTFIDATSTSGTTTGTEVSLDVADAGSWSLDATVINVPYLPLGFTDTSASVHVANDGSNEANVMATIITYCDALKLDTCVDQERSESVDLGTVPANTVAKLRQGFLMEEFGITEATKVSITFNIDADAEDISAYATVQNGEGRTEVSNSQAKVDGK